jgi:hypothetical protein
MLQLVFFLSELGTWRSIWQGRCSPQQRPTTYLPKQVYVITKYTNCKSEMDIRYQVLDTGCGDLSSLMLLAIHLLRHRAH